MHLPIFRLECHLVGAEVMAHATTSAPAEVIIEVSVQPWTIFSRNKSVGVSLIPIVLKTPDPAPALAA